MNRRTLLIGLTSFLASLGLTRGNRGIVRAASSVPDMSAYEAHRQAAIEMNELAGDIHSPADARALVARASKMFSDSLPPMWMTGSIRDRVADAEYQAATDPSLAIPEQRIVDVWNRYLTEIGAPQEEQVDTAVIHNLRDGFYATSYFFWNRGNQSIWTMPNIYSLGPDGKVAENCRALEALRVLGDLDDQPEGIRAARERVAKGIVVSDLMRARMQSGFGRAKAQIRVVAGMKSNPIADAEARYLQQRGMSEALTLMQSLFEELFPPNWAA